VSFSAPRSRVPYLFNASPARGQMLGLPIHQDAGEGTHQFVYRGGLLTLNSWRSQHLVCLDNLLQPSCSHAASAALYSA
jgi:hypothetical protein